jgi:hypothetical protein
MGLIKKAPAGAKTPEIKDKQEHDTNKKKTTDDQDDEDDDDEYDDEEVSERADQKPKGLKELIHGEKKKADNARAKSGVSDQSKSGAAMQQHGDELEDDDDNWSDTQASSARPGEVLGLRELMAIEKKKYDRAVQKEKMEKQQQQQPQQGKPNVDSKKNLSKAIAEEALQRVKQGKDENEDDEEEDEEDEDVTRAYKKSIEEENEEGLDEDEAREPQSIMKKKKVSGDAADERRLSIKEDDLAVKDVRKLQQQQPKNQHHAKRDQEEDEEDEEDEEGSEFDDQEEEELQPNMTLRQQPKLANKVLTEDFEVDFVT